MVLILLEMAQLWKKQIDFKKKNDFPIHNNSHSTIKNRKNTFKIQILFMHVPYFVATFVLGSRL